jgi:hypothetical protein
MAKSPGKSSERGLRKTMGSLGLEELEAELCLSEVERGKRVLVFQLIALLVSFACEALTMGLAQESWAEVRVQDFDP